MEPETVTPHSLFSVEPAPVVQPEPKKKAKPKMPHNRLGLWRFWKVANEALDLGLALESEQEFANWDGDKFRACKETLIAALNPLAPVGAPPKIPTLDGAMSILRSFNLAHEPYYHRTESELNVARSVLERLWPCECLPAFAFSFYVRICATGELQLWDYQGRRSTDGGRNFHDPGWK